MQILNNIVYDKTVRHTLWQILLLYETGGKLLKAVQSFYVEMLCIRVLNGYWDVP